MLNNMITCQICGEEVEACQEMENICENCYEDNYCICELCGSTVENDESYIISDMVICEHCRWNDENVFYCEYHAELEFDEEHFRVENYGEICQEAYEYGEFGTCEACWNMYHIDELMVHNDCWYCEDCCPNDIIGEYHEHAYDKKYFGEDDNIASLTFGVELEVENEGNAENEDMASDIIEMTDLFVFEYDGSLNDGFEIISSPFSMNYAVENQGIFEELCDKLQRNMFTSDNDTCGMHVHVGKSSFEMGKANLKTENVVENIVCIVDYFQQEMTALSRRTEDEIGNWCQFYTEAEYYEDYCRDITKDDIINAYHKDRFDRYHAVNTTNAKTVEFRIFRGTTDFDTYMANLELVANIVEYARDHKFENLNELDFVEIATYKYNNYIGTMVENCL